jgi:hypothetical protein
MVSDAVLGASVNKSDQKFTVAVKTVQNYGDVKGKWMHVSMYLYVFICIAYITYIHMCILMYIYTYSFICCKLCLSIFFCGYFS